MLDEYLDKIKKAKDDNEIKLIIAQFGMISCHSSEILYECEKYELQYNGI